MHVDFARVGDGEVMDFIRGRINRATYLALLGIFAALMVAVSLLAARPVGVLEVLLIVICIPRLHDIGRSGWWTLVGLGIELAGLVVVLALVPRDYVNAASWSPTLAVFGLLIWLGCLRGDPQSNRFGLPPRGGVDLNPRPKAKPHTVQPQPPA